MDLKKIVYNFSVSLLLLFPVAATAQPKVLYPEGRTPVDLVDPLIGTFSTTALSAGNTYPGVGRPFGMNTWSPQTGDNHDRGLYTYQSNFIYGFRQTRQASYWIGDYGQFSLMPVTGIQQFTQEKRKSWFSHKAETSTPYFYKTYLGDHHAHVAFTATERAAMFQVNFHPTDSAFIVVDAFDSSSYVSIIPGQNRITGYSTANQGGVTKSFRNYFVMEFSEPFLSTAVWDHDTLHNDRLEMNSRHAGAIVGFRNRNGQTIEVKVASSFISPEQALLNLQELGNKNFEQLKQESKHAWNKALQKIEVEGGTNEQLRIFYSCFYRMLVFPRKFYEIDASGSTIHYSPYTGKTEKGKLYADNGFWDTHRTQFPFLNLFFPEIVAEVLESMTLTYRQSGWLPEWFSPGHRDCMIGSHSSSIVADAFLKGIRGGDIKLLYEGVIKNTTQSGPLSSLGRLGADFYNSKGYIPYNVGINQNVSRTLEYAYNDFAIYQLAKALQKKAGETDLYLKRSRNYKNIFDSSTGLMRPRANDGGFIQPFDPFRWGEHFTEANSWQYSWFVPHDPIGLANLMGGNKAFLKKLDSVFTLPPVFDITYYKRGIIHLVREMQGVDMGQYAHLNEPMHHVAYLYNYSEPWKAQYWVREIMDRLYTDSPDGYPGEEDNGQMSAWYVFSALGFYPMNPVSNQYVFGSPLFKKTILRLGNGNVITVTAPANDHKNRFIKNVKVNGKSRKENWVGYETIAKGGAIHFDLTEHEDHKRGTSITDFPFSVSVSTVDKTDQ